MNVNLKMLSEIVGKYNAKMMILKTFIPVFIEWNVAVLVLVHEFNKNVDARTLPSMYVLLYDYF